MIWWHESVAGDFVILNFAGKTKSYNYARLFEKTDGAKSVQVSQAKSADASSPSLSNKMMSTLEKMCIRNYPPHKNMLYVYVCMYI